MKHLFITTSLLTCLALPFNTFAQNNTEQLDQEARNIAKQFLGQLKPELQKSMKSQGAAKTVAFCHTKAPEIAKSIAQQTGWDINRVSLKPRGENATPDQWEAAVLKRFNNQVANGVPPKTIEFSAIVKTGGQTEYRYMKAIPTGNVCLACHGSKIAPPIQDTLQQLYPNDSATGYSKGQIRGAFSFSKTL
ncbi:MAG TPA: DUF3365 domain-containing protein [Thiomicrorhabdus sp.]|nr:DUF3365 domain-containing protein [Thiomicrorhabdus sp.]